MTEPFQVERKEVGEDGSPRVVLKRGGKADEFVIAFADPEQDHEAGTTYTLSGGEGPQTLAVDNDLEPGDGFQALVFKGLSQGVAYTLKETRSNGVELILFCDEVLIP